MKESKKEIINNETTEKNNTLQVITVIINFLQLFIPITIAKRLVGMILITVGVSNSEITELTGLCDKSVRTLRKSMKEENIEDLLKIKEGSGRKSKTNGIEKQIIEEIEKNNYHTRQQIADMIEEKFNIHDSVYTVGRILKKNGIKRLKCGSLPAKADVTKQRKFYDEVLQPLMKEAKAGTSVLLFLDASHFVMGCDFLGYIYGKVRRFITTFSGRKRYNVLGAIDFITKNVLTVVNDSYITASEVCEMLNKISNNYSGQTIHVILDNARYQKCKMVQDLANSLNIELVYIPPYSPNLNLIERFWKFVKAELRSKYYDDFDLFKHKIDSIIQSSTKDNKDKVSSVIGEKIQLFDNLSQVSENTYVNIIDKNQAV